MKAIYGDFCLTFGFYIHNPVEQYDAWLGNIT